MDEVGLVEALDWDSGSSLSYDSCAACLIPAHILIRYLFETLRKSSPLHSLGFQKPKL